MNGWQEIPLGSLLTRIKDEVLIQDFEKYQRLTIRTNNKGIEIRDEVEGHLIGTKNQYVVHGGQFLLSKIDAMNGAFGIVPEHVENGIITSNFWAYDVDEEKLFPKYFNYLTHTNSFQEFCIQASSGTTHRKYLREDLFLGMEIPLPPLTEQRRIVAHIESLAARVNEAQSLREEADDEASKIMAGVLHDLFVEHETTHPRSLIGDVADIIDPNPSHRMPQYAEKGVSFISTVDFEGSEGIKRRTIKHVTEETYREQVERCKFEVGDLLYSRIGTIGQARELTEVWEFALSHVLVVVKPVRNLVLPRFLLWYLRSDSIISQAEEATRSVGVPDLGIKRIRNFHMPLPPLDEQRRIVAYLDGLQAKVNALRELQVKSGEELDALLPSVLDKAFKGEL